MALKLKWMELEEHVQQKDGYLIVKFIKALIKLKNYQIVKHVIQIIIW